MLVVCPFWVKPMATTCGLAYQSLHLALNQISLPPLAFPIPLALVSLTALTPLGHIGFLRLCNTLTLSITTQPLCLEGHKPWFSEALIFTAEPPPPTYPWLGSLGLVPWCFFSHNYKWFLERNPGQFPSLGLYWHGMRKEWFRSYSFLWPWKKNFWHCHWKSWDFSYYLLSVFLSVHSGPPGGDSDHPHPPGPKRLASRHGSTTSARIPFTKSREVAFVSCSRRNVLLS